MQEKPKELTQEELDKSNLELGRWLSSILIKVGGSCQVCLTAIENQVTIDQVIRLVKTKNKNYSPDIDEDEFLYTPFKLEVLDKLEIEEQLKIKKPGYIG